MKVSEALYESVKEIWASYLEHPFVKGLGEGTVEPEQFRFYMIQDYVYLLEYAKVFALGVVKSKEETLMRAFAELVHGTLDGEMNIHKSYMKRLGISEEEVKGAKASFANRSYTSYMLEVAYNGDVLDILVAILSCAWSYQMIGEHHGRLKGTKEHPLYGEWVEGYSCEAYQKSTKDIIALVDALGEGISPERLETLQEIFVNCSRHEYAFWEMSYQREL